MSRAARAFLARGYTVIKDMNAQSKWQTSLQYTKMNLIPLAKVLIPQLTIGTARLLKYITAKGFNSVGAPDGLVSFIKADSEEDSEEYKKLVGLLRMAIAMVPLTEIKELCAGLDISSTSFVIFLQNFSGPNVEEIISKIEDIPGVKEMHEFLESKGIKVLGDDGMVQNVMEESEEVDSDDDNMIKSVLETEVLLLKSLLVFKPPYNEWNDRT